VTQKNLISIECERCFLMVSFAIPASVALSQCTVVGGCGWPSSCKTNRRIFPSLHFKNKAPNSASAAEDTTNFNIPKALSGATPK
jgi:hypothetical protein